MNAIAWYKSRVFISSIVALLFALLANFKIELPDDLQGQVTDMLLLLGTIVSTVWTLKSLPKEGLKITTTQEKAEEIKSGNPPPPAAGLLLLLGLSFMLSACADMDAQVERLTPPVPKTPAQAVFLAKGEYNAILVAAVHYNELPRCLPQGGQRLCSNAAVVDQIRRADAVALAALDAAEATVRNPLFGGQILTSSAVAATNAVGAYKEILKQFGVQ